MKSLKLILLLLLAPITFFGQSLSGLWMGNLTNDSTSVRQDQSFEIVLSQYKEKVTGYSRSTFIVNDTLYYIVKRVKGTISGDVCEVKDDYVVSHNFPKKPEKGVKVISTFRRNVDDSTWYLVGDWKTTQTKKYYTVSGKVDLKEEKDVTASKLYPHLQELGLNKDIPVFAAINKIEDPVEVKTKSKVETVSSPTKNAVAGTNTQTLKPASSDVIRPGTVNTIPVKKEPTDEVAKINSSTPPKPETTSTAKPEQKIEENSIVKNTTTTAKNNTNIPVEQKPVATPAVVPPSQTNTNPVNAIAKNNNPPVTKTAVTLQPANNPVDNNSIAKQATSPRPEQSSPAKPVSDIAKTNTTINKPVTDEKKLSTTTSKDVVAATTNPTPPKTITPVPEIQKSADPVNNRAVALLTERKTEAPQYVNYVSDSLVLILYDNGEVDGDTVSVLLNGAMLMEKQGLKTSALKKTIYITPGNEELTLVLFAENLGKYPPNTGLLVVYDGEERHQLRFSADFQKNASVVFRRKK